jgi:hypothetical protein
MAEDRQRQERMWAMLCHAAAFAGLVTFVGFVVGPLIVWLMKKQEFALVADQGRESLNFQMSMLIHFALAVLLSLILIGIPLLIAWGVFEIVIVAIAAVRANNGEQYRYPLNLRLVK